MAAALRLCSCHGEPMQSKGRSPAGTQLGRCRHKQRARKKKYLQTDKGRAEKKRAKNTPNQLIARRRRVLNQQRRRIIERLEELHGSKS